MKICVTGFKGRLGSQLIHSGCFPLECNVTSGMEIRKAIEKEKPDVIINCAAITDVDKCEDMVFYRKEVLPVNFRGATNIRDVFDGMLIQISTDYVFDCTEGPYNENYKDLKPFNNYGFSKFGAEAGLCPWIKSREQTFIVRTTGLYGGVSGKNDFVSTVLLYLRRKEPIKVTSQLYGNQTYIPHLAEALIKLAGVEEKGQHILHIASEEVITRYEFAMRIAEKFELDSSCIIPCMNKDVPGWIAERPTLGGLKVDKAKRYGLPIYTINQGLDELKKTL